MKGKLLLPGLHSDFSMPGSATIYLLVRLYEVADAISSLIFRRTRIAAAAQSANSLSAIRGLCAWFAANAADLRHPRKRDPLNTVFYVKHSFIPSVHSLGQHGYSTGSWCWGRRRGFLRMSARTGAKFLTNIAKGRAGLVALRRYRGGTNALGRAFYKGGFEKQMNRREAALILETPYVMPPNSRYGF